MKRPRPTDRAALMEILAELKEQADAVAQKEKELEAANRAVRKFVYEFEIDIRQRRCTLYHEAGEINSWKKQIFTTGLVKKPMQMDEQDFVKVPKYPAQEIVDRSSSWDVIKVPPGWRERPYNPAEWTLAEDCFFPQNYSVFPAKRRKELMGKTHLDIVIEDFLEAPKRLELEVCYGMCFVGGCYHSDENRFISAEIQNFCTSEDITIHQIYPLLQNRKTKLKLLSQLSAILVWREKTSIVKKLESLTKPKFEPAPFLEHPLWSGDEDRILLEVLNQPKFKLEFDQDHNTETWKEIAKYCEGEDFDRDAVQCQKRWNNHLQPRLRNGGYFPQFFQGDWLTLIGKLREKGFRDECADDFNWEEVKFHVFTGAFLKRCWAVCHPCEKIKDFEAFYQSMLDEHNGYTKEQLNKTIHGGGQHNPAVFSLLRKKINREHQDAHRY
ncbi:hypothetical protein PTTG_29047 [Puccinia triticina 1-1 BBBD Race 1]|uniref:Myb-like domain-containing protein n=2 Tax=Puccinia triticina TaxID=208348 RepID=A0A180G742_PUCT1|nr:uncharacterized protein PtA15_16A217 [Puccinia triticina]OAV88388.1 hypothetical protein PTTG_29047 [Puccinia triticina 1-1 BBBD Race 1]WAQ92311.1 hypothetical protein PtA15_16A217 [Puccinia triticina]WAR64048.1 hypothetical protein PtB15_16B207 [Puccinia triticina]